MQIYAIVLGGLESSYMRKLALCLKTRMPVWVQVQITEKEQMQPDFAHDVSKMWIGSEEFIRSLSGSDLCKNAIILSEDEMEDESHIFRYQSCEKLYRGIWRRCRQAYHLLSAGNAGRRQKWLVVTTDGSVGDLLAFSMTCAQILGERERVLYVNLSECCGMEEVFSLERDVDLEELFLELQRSQEMQIENFCGRIGNTDYLMPATNPMILHEIRAEDMERFLNIIQNAPQYKSIVFAMGNTLCGCDRIFAMAERIFHLTGRGAVNNCVKNMWMGFIRQCRQEQEDKMIELIPAPDTFEGSTGFQLIDEWTDGEWGRIARKYLKDGREEADGNTVAGN